MRLLILFVFVLVSSGFKSDPTAKKLMDKVDQYYKSIGGFEILFSYEIDSEKEKIKGQSGSLSARGDKFKLVLSEFELYCNGKSQYTYLKKNNEIQITSPDDTDHQFRPQSLASIHKSGKFEYRLSEKVKEGGINQSVVEFKPIDSDESIFKIKLFIAESNHQITKVQWFEKSGKKTTVRFNKTNVKKSFPDTHFEPDMKKLKGVHVEDLRDE